MKFLNTILLFIFVSAISTVYGQRGAEIGGHIGVAHYFGDLNPTYAISDPGIAIGFKAKRNFNERISLALGLDYGRIKGSDSDSNNAFERSRNLDFYSNVFDGNATLEFNFFPYLHGSEDNYYTPYVFLGASLLRYNPKTDFEGQTYELRDFGTEGQGPGSEYFQLTAAWVYGIGFKWDYNRDWSFNVSLSGRRTSSDYLDDVSALYPDYTQLENRRGPIAVALANRSEDPEHGQTDTQRGNDPTNDRVFFLSIGLYRYFGRIHCPPITKNLY